MFTTDYGRVVRWERWRSHEWLVHGFSTRKAGDFLEWPAEPWIGAAFFGIGCKMAKLRQVHSGKCVCADAGWPDEPPEADAAVTDQPGVLVGVRTADCFPVLLVDPGRRAVAAVHAGWRGTVAGVLPNAVSSMVARFGSRVGAIEAAIGPGIGPCCFEVGEEVAGQFGAEFVRRDRPKPHVDLTAALESQLAALGVRQVCALRECTSCNLARYFSYRAERGSTGRMLSVAGLRPQFDR